MSQDPRSETLTNIDTGGGAHIEGTIITGGDFVSRDKIIITEEQAYNMTGYASPYMGLSAFTFTERDFYAGREADIQKALTKLTKPGEEQTVLFVTGASGSGKSSFVQAGLLPKLLGHYSARHKTPRPTIFRPGDRPNANLDDALNQLVPGGSRDLAAFTPPEQVNIVIIDQFEEVFTQAALQADDSFFSLDP